MKSPWVTVQATSQPVGAPFLADALHHMNHQDRFKCRKTGSVPDHAHSVNGKLSHNQELKVYCSLMRTTCI